MPLTPKQRDELVGQVTAAAITLRDVDRALMYLATVENRPLSEAALKACESTRALMRALGYVNEETPPIPALLHCPYCGAQHIDEGEWATRPHHNHLCGKCGKTWRVEPYCAGVKSLDERVDSSGILDGKKTPFSGGAE